MNHGRLKLAVVFAVFLGPLLASFIWYYGFDGALAPREGKNHALLISPAIALESFSNISASASTNDNTNDDTNNNEQFTNASFKDYWSVIHLLAESCEAQCQKSLYNTRQTRLALGKNTNRIQRILLAPGHDSLNRLAADHPDAIRLLESRDNTSGLEDLLNRAIEQHNIGPDDALLVDPLGNLMMIIPASLDPGLLLKDLKHLLKVSRIG